MLTTLLIALGCFGNPDNTKTKTDSIKVSKHEQQLKQVKNEFKDTIELLKKIKAQNKKKSGNEQAKKN